MPDAVSVEGITLDEDNDLPWQHVSPALAIVRSITLLSVVGAVVAVSAALALGVTGWFWALAALAVGGGGWGLWIIRRQVSAITYLELSDELVIRKGRLFRRLVSIPYGRLQYVDVQSGPVSRWLGLAALEIHTASPESGGDIPGVPVAEAEALRERLSARGESQRAGL